MMATKQIEFYAVIRDRNFERRGYSWLDLHVERIAQGKPRLNRGEVAVKIRLNVDEAAFREFIPVIEADVETRMSAAPEIEVLEQDDTDAA